MISEIVTEKTCTKCNQEKHFSEFAKQKDCKYGLTTACKKCTSINYLNYTRTIKGLISKMYGGQVMRSKQRGMPLPNYSSSDLNKWLFSNDFTSFYNVWVWSGFRKDLIPSCDRTDDYKPYTLSNMRLTTWLENNKKALNDRKIGINNKQSKTVVQYLNGKMVKEYYSIRSAQRETGINHIVRCCKGLSAHAGGYQWKYKND